MSIASPRNTFLRFNNEYFPSNKNSTVADRLYGEHICYESPEEITQDHPRSPSVMRPVCTLGLEGGVLGYISVVLVLEIEGLCDQCKITYVTLEPRHKQCLEMTLTTMKGSPHL